MRSLDEDTSQTINEEIFTSVVMNELTEDNSYLMGWQPNDVLEGKNVGTSRPWTKEGRSSHGYAQDFQATLSWYKLWKIARFEATAWNIDKEVVRKVADRFQILIDTAVKELKEEGQDEEKIEWLGKDFASVIDFLVRYDPSIISKYTATDFLFQNITNRKIENVLDFGSGIGRQAMQWDNVNFFSVDAIQAMYLLQNKVYSILFPERLVEYFANAEAFSKIELSENQNKLYHLPTWQMDRIPDDSMDLIICVQVLNELKEKTVRHVIQQFKRIAKKNCIVYIRDNEAGYSPGHKVRVGKILLEHGFEVVYRYQGLQTDMEGVPRVWSNTGFKKNLKYRILKAIDCPNTYGEFHLKVFLKALFYKVRDFGWPI